MKARPVFENLLLPGLAVTVWLQSTARCIPSGLHFISHSHVLSLRVRTAYWLQVVDPGSIAPRTLYGVCCYVRELVHRPPSMAREVRNAFRYFRWVATAAHSLYPRVLAVQGSLRAGRAAFACSAFWGSSSGAVLPPRCPSRHVTSAAM